MKKHYATHEEEAAKKICSYLVAADLAAKCHFSADNIPHVEVKISDSISRERKLIATIMDQPVSMIGKDSEEEALPAFLRVEFEMKLPFKMQPGALQDCSSLLFFLNRQSSFPGFELIEHENAFAFRYVLLNSLQEISLELVQGVVGMILFMVESHSPVIEKVAAGEMTFDEFIAEALLFHEYQESLEAPESH